ncbi:hypothetical protein [Phenylobacterium sp. J367]|uniref:hypothetical protein n=1 Tax=Phenylobacterium sp. J367 TaxID=2898435 RepID=UPI002151B6D0|nr:hypothetical protein [Phenylobacterium sp. J367]MCR5878077.1 hypothetical protein [Phenylobacterium sp. J367]
MPRISTAFFAAAVLYALCGMLMGMMMGATQDFTLRPLHAHINLLGWATLGLMGAYFGVAGERAPKRLGWTVFAMSNIGNLMLLSMLYLIVTGGKPVLPILLSGEVLVVGGMALFGATVLLAGRGPRPVALRENQPLRRAA